MSRPVLRRGSKGSVVKTLQKQLNQHGANLVVDGVFGKATLAAVKTFQKQRGLVVDGIVGTKTWTELNKKTYATIRQGNRGSLVTQLQVLLTDLNYQPGSIDGIFDAGTKAAVNAFQRANSLKVDGIVGKNTWSRLLSGNAVSNKSKEPVYYSQGDPRWGTRRYSATGNPKQTIASSGCGPTCAAMLLATLINPKIQPPELCNFALANGYRTANNGTSWAFFAAMAKKYGLTCKQTSSTDETVKALKAGKLVIASMGKGYFTNGGHYILLWKVDGNNIICHDPAKKSRNKASINTVFKKQSKQYWVLG